VDLISLSSNSLAQEIMKNVLLLRTTKM